MCLPLTPSSLRALPMAWFMWQAPCMLQDGGQCQHLHRFGLVALR